MNVAKVSKNLFTTAERSSKLRRGSAGMRFYTAGDNYEVKDSWSDRS